MARERKFLLSVCSLSVFRKMSDNKDVFVLLEELHASCKKQAPIKSEQAIFNLQEASKKALAANIDGHYEDYRQLYVINDLINNLVDSLYTV